MANRLTALGVTLDGTVLTTIEYAYDAAGYTQTIEQDKGFTNGVKIEYNLETVNGELQYVSDPLGRIRNETKTVRTGQSSSALTVSYEYDATGNVTGITYPNGRTIPYTVNALGQVTAIDGFVTLASYDKTEGGLLTSLTLANGTSESFTYDANGRLTSLAHNLGTTELARFDLTYDNANNVLKRYSTQSKDNVYDALNRLKTAYVKGPFLVATTAKDLSGGIVEQDFTGQKSLGTGQTITGFSLDMSANSLGIKLLNPHLVSRIELVPGASEHRLRRESIDIFVSDDNSENTYHLVPRDNWTFTKASGGVVILEFKPALNTTYIKVHCKYDDRNETLGFDSTKATFKQAGGAFIGTMVKVYHLAQERTEDYTHDAVGNRQSSSYTYEGPDTEEKQTYQYYTNSDRLRTDGKFAFKYDANGNLVEKGTAFTIVGDVVTFTATYGEGVEYWKYDYDALNRLVKVTKSGLTADDETVVEYVYDPTGLRLLKAKGTSTTQYAFDLAGNQIYDTAGGQEHCYIWVFGKTLARVDGDKDSTVKYFFHTDMLGSTVLVTGDGGKIVWTGDVTPFGERVSGEGSLEGAVRFTGKEYDEDTGLYYFNARWYDDDIGRFISQDPLEFVTNLYDYCLNNPMLNMDPSGLAPTISLPTPTDQIFLELEWAPLVPNSGTTGSESITIPIPSFTAPDFALTAEVPSPLINNFGPQIVYVDTASGIATDSNGKSYRCHYDALDRLWLEPLVATYWVSLSLTTSQQARINLFVGAALREYELMQEKGWKENKVYNPVSGKYEGDNKNPYGDWYRNNGQPWCAMFVSYCADQADILGDIVPRYQGCYKGIEWYKDRGNYRSSASGYIPRAGDVVFFMSYIYKNGQVVLDKNGNKKTQWHTGIVVAYDPIKNRVYTIEGNSGDTVMAHYYDLSNNTYIQGYGVNGGVLFNPFGIPSNATPGTKYSTR